MVYRSAIIPDKVTPSLWVIIEWQLSKPQLNSGKVTGSLCASTMFALVGNYWKTFMDRTVYNKYFHCWQRNGMCSQIQRSLLRYWDVQIGKSYTSRAVYVKSHSAKTMKKRGVSALESRRHCKQEATSQPRFFSWKIGNMGQETGNREQGRKSFHALVVDSYPWETSLKQVMFSLVQGILLSRLLLLQLLKKWMRGMLLSCGTNQRLMTTADLKLPHQKNRSDLKVGNRELLTGNRKSHGFILGGTTRFLRTAFFRFMCPLSQILTLHSVENVCVRNNKGGECVTLMVICIETTHSLLGSVISQLFELLPFTCYIFLPAMNFFEATIFTNPANFYNEQLIFHQSY
jgi:hypothetical protein